MNRALQIVDSPRPLKGEILPTLSAREKEFLILVASGHTMTNAARVMGIKYRTADAYSQRIRLKTRCHGIADLTRYAIRTGLVKA